MRLLLVWLAASVLSVGLRVAADVDYYADTNDGLDSPDAEAADVDYVADGGAEEVAADTAEAGTPAQTMTDIGVPLTIEHPPGHHQLGIRYHLAHFGAVPYGQEFPRYASTNINNCSITADRILSRQVHGAQDCRPAESIKFCGKILLRW